MRASVMLFLAASVFVVQRRCVPRARAGRGRDGGRGRALTIITGGAAGKNQAETAGVLLAGWQCRR